MPDITKPSIAESYRNKFARQTTSLTEATGENVAVDFKETEVKDRLDASKKELRRIIKKYFNNDSALKAAANKIIKNSEDPLRAVANIDDNFLNIHPESLNFLEVIVQTDGSRPSFMIKEGVVDLESSPADNWKNALAQSDTKLKHAIECVGRINIGRRHIGTGFLIHRDLIITNRHVLQSIAAESNGNWNFVQGANIDFGYEYKARLSVNPRDLIKVLYCGPDPINRFKIDHSKLDLALIQVAPTTDDKVPLSILSWDSSSTWAWPDTNLYTIGYPGDPGAEGVTIYTETVLDKLFKQTYGCKRLAPGKVMTGPDDANKWRLSHDASTLGGNSGSVMLVRSSEYIASGLHYGGDVGEPRENWGHVLGKTLDKKNADNKTLLDCLNEFEVNLVKSDG